MGIETQASLAEDIAAQVLIVLAPVADMLGGQCVLAPLL